MTLCLLPHELYELFHWYGSDQSLQTFWRVVIEKKFPLLSKDLQICPQQDAGKPFREVGGIKA